MTFVDKKNNNQQEHRVQREDGESADAVKTKKYCLKLSSFKVGLLRLAVRNNACDWIT